MDSSKSSTVRASGFWLLAVGHGSGEEKLSLGERSTRSASGAEAPRTPVASYTEWETGALDWKLEAGCWRRQQHESES